MAVFEGVGVCVPGLNFGWDAGYSDSVFMVFVTLSR